MNIIVDSNIIFSALIKSENKFRELIMFNERFNFISSNFLIVELFKLKEKLMKFSKLSELDLLSSYHLLLNQIDFVNDNLISKNNIKKAYDLCHSIDVKDTIFVALTIEFDGLLWTADKKLIKGLHSKGFNRFFNIDDNFHTSDFYYEV